MPPALNEEIAQEIGEGTARFTKNIIIRFLRWFKNKFIRIRWRRTPYHLNQD